MLPNACREGQPHGGERLQRPRRPLQCLRLLLSSSGSNLQEKNMLHRHPSARGLGLAALLALLALPLSGRPNPGTAEPDHLVWARQLVAGVTPETNLYASRPTIVTWTGVNGATETRNRTVCRSLAAPLFMQPHGSRAADCAAWLRGRFPLAAGY